MLLFLCYPVSHVVVTLLSNSIRRRKMDYILTLTDLLTMLVGKSSHLNYLSNAIWKYLWFVSLNGSVEVIIA